VAMLCQRLESKAFIAFSFFGLPAEPGSPACSCDCYAIGLMYLPYQPPMISRNEM